MSGIVWLASYPKSGNTWIRCLLASLAAGGAAPDLRRLGRFIPNGAIRAWAETVLDVPSEDMTPAELLQLRATAYRQVAGAGSRQSLLKIHDQFDPALFPPEATAGIVYIVRDPRDVAPSWADHMNVSLETAIERMAEPGFTVARTRTLFHPHIEQHLGNWSQHVASWLDQDVLAPPRLLLLRYEDLLAEPLEAVTRLAAFLRLPVGPETIGQAVQACRFEALQSAEIQSGFPEKEGQTGHFFRQGRAGQWRQVLSAEQAARIVRDHGAVMARLGYGIGEGEAPGCQSMRQDMPVSPVTWNPSRR